MQPAPTVEFRLAPEEDHAELLRMYAEQTNILHGFDASVTPNQKLQSVWWQKPDDLFPYMIYQGAKPVGFCLVMGARYVAATGEEGDFIIWEMFVDQPQRGSGVAEAAVHAILASLPGRWSLVAMPKNGRAMGFWRRLLLTETYAGVEGLNDEGFATFHFVAP